MTRGSRNRLRHSFPRVSGSVQYQGIPSETTLPSEVSSIFVTPFSLKRIKKSKSRHKGFIEIPTVCEDIVLGICYCFYCPVIFLSFFMILPVLCKKECQNVRVTGRIMEYVLSIS